ncbi:unnamed protein product [Calicophoron daubneyi]|uniref:Uncharacterized protein n=1 Tax=Calicophoron daubneyi TaxID=300641 RepID=A0AAV2T514_CALDB
MILWLLLECLTLIYSAKKSPFNARELFNQDANHLPRVWLKHMAWLNDLGQSILGHRPKVHVFFPSSWMQTDQDVKSQFDFRSKLLILVKLIIGFVMVQLFYAV